MALVRKKLVARGGPKPKAMSVQSAGKGKPATKKPAAKPAGKTVVKPVIKSSAKHPAKPMKPAAKPAASPAAKGKSPAGKPAAKPAVLNKGAAAAKALAEARAAAAAAAAEAAKRPPKLVPATPGAIRPGAAKAPPAKGKSAPKPPAEVRPLGVLPPESMAKSRPAPQHARAVIPARPQAMHPRSDAGARTGVKGDERLTESDLKHFEQRLLDERARIMREMGHLENTVLKVNPRDSAGEVGGGYSFHMADAGTDSMEREISFDIASKEGRLLREIDDALRRIYNGVYGICEASGQPISKARLEALPWARYTVQEQENMERKQRAGRLLKEEE